MTRNSFNLTPITGETTQCQLNRSDVTQTSAEFSSSSHIDHWNKLLTEIVSKTAISSVKDFGDILTLYFLPVVC